MTLEGIGFVDDGGNDRHARVAVAVAATVLLLEFET